MKFIQATVEHHKAIVELAKVSRYTLDFSHMMFSAPVMYERGWIWIAQQEKGSVVGFSCVRHKKRQPETKLYFIGVHPNVQGCGIGRKLLRVVEQNSPHPVVVLDVEEDNVGALVFYKRLGYNTVAEKTLGKKKVKKAYELRKQL